MPQGLNFKIYKNEVQQTIEEAEEQAASWAAWFLVGMSIAAFLVGCVAAYFMDKPVIK